MTSECQYSNGHIHGEMKFYLDDDRHLSARIVHFKNGELDGDAVYYDSLSGKVVSAGKFVNGKKQDRWVYYHKGTDNIKTEGGYDKGSRTGEWKRYFMANGKLRIREMYDEDKLNGKFEAYDSASGNIIKKGKIENDERDGEWTFYTNSGKLKGVEHYKAGKLDGIVKTFDTTGRIHSTGTYDKGIRDGNFKQNYYASDQLWIDVNYRKNKFHGTLTSYYPSGKIKRKEYYEEGEQKKATCYTESGTETDYYPLISMAEFKGDVMIYIGNNLTYPENAQVRKEGKVVVGFYVNESGLIKDAEVLKGFDPECEDEAVRLVSQMPPWTPGSIDGMPCTTYQTLPIVFWAH